MPELPCFLAAAAARAETGAPFLTERVRLTPLVAEEPTPDAGDEAILEGERLRAAAVEEAAAVLELVFGVRRPGPVEELLLAAGLLLLGVAADMVEVEAGVECEERLRVSNVSSAGARACNACRYLTQACAIFFP